MRKLNFFLVAGMMVTFLLHAITGALRLAGASSTPQPFIARAAATFALAHVVVTTILTVQTLRARRLSGAGYFRGNGLFWARRISGFAIIIPLIMHLMIFTTTNSGAMRLEVFTRGRLISQILLVVTIAFHALTNMRPLLISLGVRETRSFAADLIVILSVLLLLFAVAFAIYYFRWAAY